MSNSRSFVTVTVTSRRTSGNVLVVFQLVITFLVIHFNTVAVSENMNVSRLVPVELNAASWKAQYPVGMTFESPSLDAMRATNGEPVKNDANH